MKYPEKVERQPDRIAVVRYPKKVGCRPDKIAAVRHPGGMSDDFPSKWNERCHVSQGGGLRVQGRGSHVAFFGEDPTGVTLKSYFL